MWFHIGFPAVCLFSSVIYVLTCRLSAMCGSVRRKCLLRSACCVFLYGFCTVRVSGGSVILMCFTTCAYVGGNATVSVLMALSYGCDSALCLVIGLLMFVD